MARVTMQFAILLAALICTTASAKQQQLSAEVPDPEAVQAFREYWSNFEKYEEMLIRDGKDRYQRKWRQIKQDYEKDRRKLSEQQIAKLKKSANKYWQHLADHPQAKNRPLVMLNLAQILNLMGGVLAEQDPDAGEQERVKALSLLKEVEQSFPKFTYREETLYLRALILEALGREETALAVWKQLADTAKNSMFGTYANIAIGDTYFARNEPQVSVSYFQRALKLVTSVADVKDRDYETLRVQYRLAWAAYRSANLKLATEMAGKLLTPGRQMRSQKSQKNIRQDAIELIGDALYEQNEMEVTKTTLRKGGYDRFASAIGYRTLSRYAQGSIHSEVVELGEFLIKRFPMGKEAPDVMTVLAASYRKLNKHEKQAKTLESLAMLLPKQSLWRSRHREDHSAELHMQTRAIDGARLAAAYFYEHGMNSTNYNSFMRAAGLYEILIENDPNVERSVGWRIKYAHCHYFANRIERASDLYVDLKKNYKLKASDLEIVSYQLVLSREKLWRQAFSKAVEKGGNADKDPVTIAELKKLESAINEFSNRFPDRSRSVDLLLVVAAANRDMGRRDAAGSYWERVLISKPTAPQRAMAIRGLVMAQMQGGASSQVVKLARRFLKLEDWESLGLSLGSELQGVLSTAALDEGNRLNKTGDVHAAGVLLIQISNEFPQIPQRDKIYRDGAYMLAIAGDWSGAQEAAKGYLKTNLNKNRGDVYYLLGRSNEFQMRFKDAAAAYLELGTRYPKHPRAATSLLRAKNLSLAENDYSSAAQASALYAQNHSKGASQLTSYEESIKYYSEADATDKALKQARKRRQLSKTRGEQLRSDLLVAKVMYDAGQESKSLAAMARIAARSRDSRQSIDSKTFQDTYGETNFFLGAEAEEQFNDFSVTGRRGSISDNLRIKTKYFEKLVTYFDRAALSGHPEWSTRARYQLAESCERFSDEVTAIDSQLKLDKKFGLANKLKLPASAKRLQMMAKKYYSSNLLARNKDPKRFKNSAWVKKSAIKLNGYTNTDVKVQRDHQLPEAAHLDLPHQWSL